MEIKETNETELIDDTKPILERLIIQRYILEAQGLILKNEINNLEKDNEDKNL